MSDTRRTIKARTEHENRLELLMFYLATPQRFGINVLKVKEVIPCPHLTKVPESGPAVRGVAHLRGEPLTVIDLSQAVGRPPLFDDEQCENGSIIVTEINRSRQGFLVSKVDRIIVCDWNNVLPPPSGTGLGSYITGVTRVDEQLVQILDVEKIIGEVIEPIEEEQVSQFDIPEQELAAVKGRRVLVVDDSTVARNQSARALDAIGVDHLLARDGKEALDELKAIYADPEQAPIDLVISDIEMPEMDGYSLTRAMRQDERMRDIRILLHTSLNGAINTEKAHKAGADDALTKFVPEELARAVVKLLLSQ